MTRYFDLVQGYESLATVYDSAIEQASEGKGKERHAEDGEPYERQIICEVARRVGLGYPLGQAVKKIYESQRLIPQLGVQELLGAMNYLAAAVIVMQERMEEEGRRFREGFANAKTEDGCCQNGNDQQEFKYGDRVQFRDEIPSTSEPHWFEGVYVERLSTGGHAVKFGPHGHVIHCSDKEIRPAPRVEGCEELVEKDAPQTPEELYQHIVDCNPSVYKPRTPTGEELAEMAEEEKRG